MFVKNSCKGGLFTFRHEVGILYEDFRRMILEIEVSLYVDAVSAAVWAVKRCTRGC